MTKATETPFHVVAFLGPAGAGKSTSAAMLCHYAHLLEGRSFKTLSFAGPLKKILRDQNPMVDTVEAGAWRLKDALADWPEAEVKHRFHEYRRLLQATGDAVKRHDPEFFVNAMRREIVKASRDYSGVLIDDLRFPAELDGLLSLPGAGFTVTTIRILPIEEPSLEGAHVSETAMADYEADYTVQAGELDELGRQLSDVYKAITEGSHGV